MRSVVFLFVGFVFWGSAYAQKDTSALYTGVLPAREDSLEVFLNDLRAAQNDLEREEKNTLFKNYLRETLREKAAFSYPFSKLKTIGFIDSPDGLLRIVN